MDLKIDHPAYMLGGGSGGSGELRGGSNGESSHDIFKPGTTLPSCAFFGSTPTLVFKCARI